MEFFFVKRVQMHGAVVHVDADASVSQLAKWKTTLQMVALGFLICGPAGDRIVPYITYVGLLLLWVSALLTLYTGYDYFRAGLKHLMSEDA